MKKFNVGIIGVGRIGKVHAKSIIYHLPNVTVKGVTDVNLDGVKEWADSLGIEKVYADHSEMLADKDIDAVLVCSSTDTHAKISIESARAGKHVFCEKPVDAQVAKIREVLEVIEETGVKFQVGFNRRFDHNFARIKEQANSGVLGDPHIIKITSRDPQAPPISYVKVSGGMFFDMTIHDFDMARFMADSEVVSVYASGKSLVNPEIGEAGDVDTAAVVLNFANGAVALIDNSREAAYGYDQRVEYFGSKGSCEARNDTKTNTVLRTKDSVSMDKPLYFFLERYMESFTTEVGLFFEAIEKDTEPVVGGKDGLESVRVAMAATKSVKEGRLVMMDEIE